MKKKVLTNFFALLFTAAFLAPSVSGVSANAEVVGNKAYVIRDYSQYAGSANFMVGGFFAPDLTNEAEVNTLDRKSVV